MWKITCNDIHYLGTTASGNTYRGVTFEGVGMTNDPDIAEEFRSLGLHHGGVPIFSVEEVDEETNLDE